MQRKTITKADLVPAKPKHSLGYFMNHMCNIQLMGYQHDKFVTGEVEAITQYEVFIKTDEGLVAIFKHSIISISRA